MKITVYLGANEGNDPSLKEAVKELGVWIGENGHTLVYGGSKTGLMGELAGSVLEAGLLSAMQELQSSLHRQPLKELLLIFLSIQR